MRGDGPVGEAQYRRGPLLGHQVAEGREESPQLRCASAVRGQRSEGCAGSSEGCTGGSDACAGSSVGCTGCSAGLRYRLLGCSAGPAGSPAANSLMRPWARWEESPGILRAGRAGPRPPSAVPWRLSGPQLFTSRS